MKDEKTIREGIREATRDPSGERLRRDDTPSEPGMPEAVNLEREEPITDAARRRDAFGAGERIPERAVRAEQDARTVARKGAGRPGPQSETTEGDASANVQTGATPVNRPQADELERT